MSNETVNNQGTSEVTIFTYGQGTTEIGRLSHVSVGGGAAAYDYDYDVFGRRTSEELTAGSVTTRTEYAYDLADRISEVRYGLPANPGVLNVKYNRTANGNGDVIGIDDQSASAPVPIVSNVAFVPFGPAKTITFGNQSLAQQVLTRNFDKRYRLSSETVAGPSWSADWTYDAVDRLINWNDPQKNSWNYGYDALDHVQFESDDGDLYYTYTNDSNGNRTNYFYWYGEPEQNIDFTYVAGTNRLSQFTNYGQTYHPAYDAAGNLTDTGEPGSQGYLLAYDSAGRTRSARSSWTNATVGIYSYNHLGERYRKVASASYYSSTVLFSYLPDGKLLGETQLTNGVPTTQRTYVWLGDQPVGFQIANLNSSGGVTRAMFYVYTDHLNAPLRMTNAQGQLAYQRYANGFGEGWASTSTDIGFYAMSLRLPGQYFDWEIYPLTYNYHRNYWPHIGQYVQPDPIGLAGGLNPYLYVDGNPLRYVDPTGLAKSDDAAIAQAVLRGDVNQLRFLLKEVNYLSRAQSDALIKQCAENIPDKIGTIASRLGRSEKEIARAIEQVKQRGLPRGGPLRNPDVRVDPRGEVFPKTPEGSIGDSIGNIFDFLR